MKKKLLGLLLVLVVTNGVANDDSGELVVALAQSAAQIYVAADNNNKSQPTQKNYLKRISWLYKNNPHFYKLHSFKEDLPYYLAALPDKIKELQAKIAAKKSGLCSNAMLNGVITTGLSALSGYGAYFMYQQKNNGTFISSLRSQDLMSGCVGMSLISAFFAAIAANNFHKVIYYADRLVERLDRYKKILELLENEKAITGEGTIDAAAIKLMKVVVEAITVAVDQAMVAVDKANAATTGANTSALSFTA
jgi:hypothetical protein